MSGQITVIPEPELRASTRKIIPVCNLFVTPNSKPSRPWKGNNHAHEFLSAAENIPRIQGSRILFGV